MPTDCSARSSILKPSRAARLWAVSMAARSRSDAGALLLGEADRAIGLTGRLRAAFSDERDPELVVHELRDAGRRSGCSGSRSATRISTTTTSCATIRCWRAVGQARAASARTARRSPASRRSTGWSTAQGPSRPLSQDRASTTRRSSSVFVDVFVEAHKSPPKRIILDLDATDDPLHGNQEGRFFHGYYAATATCRSTSSAAAICWSPSSGGPTSTPRPARWRRSPASWRTCAGLAGGRDLAAGRLRLCARRADELVRGERRRLRVRAGAQRAAGADDRRRAGRRPRRRSRRRASRRACSRSSTTARGTAGRRAAAWWPRPSIWRKAPIRASSSPRCRPSRSADRSSTRRSTARAARWRTASRSASSISLPIAPRPRPCGPTSCGCGSPRWPMCCWRRCAASALHGTDMANATAGTIRLKLLEDRRAGDGERAPHQDRLRHRLPGQGVVRPPPSSGCAPCAARGRQSPSRPDAAPPATDQHTEEQRRACQNRHQRQRRRPPRPSQSIRQRPTGGWLDETERECEKCGLAAIGAAYSSAAGLAL